MQAWETPPGSPRLPRLPSQGRAVTASGSRITGFPKEFWLTPRTPLSENTPIGTINRFCADHGFKMWELGGRNPCEQRWALFRLLEKHRWPVGYSAYMRALNSPRQPRPPPNLPAMEEHKREVARTMSRAASARGSVDDLVRRASMSYFPGGASAYSPDDVMHPPGSATSPERVRDALLGMDAFGDAAEPIEALISVLKHQTSITERWQQMFMEQAGSPRTSPTKAGRDARAPGAPEEVLLSTRAAAAADSICLLPSLLDCVSSAHLLCASGRGGQAPRAPLVTFEIKKGAQYVAIAIRAARDCRSVGSSLERRRRAG